MQQSKTPWKRIWEIKTCRWKWKTFPRSSVTMNLGWNFKLWHLAIVVSSLSPNKMLRSPWSVSKYFMHQATGFNWRMSTPSLEEKFCLRPRTVRLCQIRTGDTPPHVKTVILPKSSQSSRSSLLTTEVSPATERGHQVKVGTSPSSVSAMNKNDKSNNF